VHCHAGINRSAAIVVACLMHLHEMDALTAVLKVWTARPVILQNRAFVEQLAMLQLSLLELAPSRWHTTRRDLGGIQSVEEASVDAAAAPTAAAVLERLLESLPAALLREVDPASIDTSAGVAAALAAGAGLESLPAEMSAWCMALLRTPRRPPHAEFDPLM